MTTNATHSVPLPPAEPRRKSPWLPRSPEAAGLFVLTAVSLAWPLILAAVWSYISAVGCFFDCDSPDPTYWAAGAFGLLAAAILTSPFAAVRLYQGRGPGPLTARVAAILLVNAAAVVFTMIWFLPT
jgi:hypothetical protein